MPALSSGGSDPHGATVLKVGLMLTGHIPCIRTTHPPPARTGRLLTSSTPTGTHVPCRGNRRIHESPNCWMLRTALSPARSSSPNITPRSVGSRPTPREPCSLHRGHTWQRKKKCALSFQLVPQVRRHRLRKHAASVPTVPSLCTVCHGVLLCGSVNGTHMFLGHLAVKSATFFLQGHLLQSPTASTPYF